MYLISETDSSEEDVGESESSDLDELKHLNLPSNGLSVADVIEKAKQQSNRNIEVGSKTKLAKYITYDFISV